MNQYWIWFANLKISPHIKQRLLAHFSDVYQIYDARDSAYREVVGISARAREALAQKSLWEVKQILTYCEKNRIQIIAYEDPQYPNLLREIAMPPYVLYVRGTFPDLDHMLGISIVGTRKADKSGMNIAHHFAEELTRAGAYVISGMAEGIDGAANSGALAAGGATLAVLGCGVDVCYPKHHARLMHSIIENGAVVSEFPPQTEPLAGNFPVRNRIISGLARGVLAIQVPLKSGARITIDFAMQQNRDLFVAPGTVDSALYTASNRLIQDGAKMILQTSDILEEYQTMFPNITMDISTLKKERPSNRAFSKEEQLILDAIDVNELSVDEIIRKTNLGAQAVLAALTMLELQGDICQDAGKRFRVKQGF